MHHFSSILKLLSIAFLSIIINGCGGSTTTPIDTITNNLTTASDEFSQDSYKGLQFYYKNMVPSSYKLEQLSDSEFNSLPKLRKLQVANNLLTSLFFGYPQNKLLQKIDSGNFISSIRDNLEENQLDRDTIETKIRNEEFFHQYKNQPWRQPQTIRILTRFYAMDKLDKYYFENWIAYILTQTIMFSPAYELSTTHTPDISRVYNRLVHMLDINSGMRYITYVHMMSQDNWRRFRSPEDNGREMLEIFTLDSNDSHVPLAGKALQNWKLNTDNDTLEVGLNYNTTPIHLFETTVYTGEDFYRELAKSNAFINGATKRLVNFFFPLKSSVQKTEIAQEIVASKPEKWQDILKQILFSKEYLLHNKRPLSAEEQFYSFAKKFNFKVRRDAFSYFKDYLTNMHQATMRYKLGKLNRVPLDSISFAYYSKFAREYLFLNRAYDGETNRDSWQYDGWNSNFIDTSNFKIVEQNATATLTNFVNYIFNATISRDATSGEIALFKGHMFKDGNFKNEFNMLTRRDTDEEKERFNRRVNIAITVMDYISRLEDTYMQKEVK